MGLAGHSHVRWRVWPEFCGGSERLYARIPWDIDVLVSHGPPFGILDTAPISGLHEGCRELSDAVVRVSPKLHVFGHIHVSTVPMASSKQSTLRS